MAAVHQAVRTHPFACYEYAATAPDKRPCDWQAVSHDVLYFPNDGTQRLRHGVCIHCLHLIGWMSDDKICPNCYRAKNRDALTCSDCEGKMTRRTDRETCPECLGYKDEKKALCCRCSREWTNLP